MRLYHFGIAICSFFTASIAEKSPDSIAMVSATGDATIKKGPEVLRLSVDLLAQGPDLKSAFVAMKDRNDAARAQLVAFGANKESIRVKTPEVIGADPNARRRQMERMVMSRLQNRRKQKANAPDAKKETKLKAALTAEWKLPGSSDEEQLMFLESLKKKIGEADVSGKEESKKKSPEEEEAEEEGLMDDYRMDYGASAKQPGEPVYVFVSTASEAEVSKALADAFKNAKSAAATMAAAAGRELGDISNLSGFYIDSYTGNRVDDPYGRYDAFYARYNVGRRSQGRGREAISPALRQMVFTVTVTASFLLK
ncbi:MAG: SIMPL domain-containing protein [Planctomycetota bacterium]|nr:SIMPL domain-containing protein [Planctomycetota bacterium]